MRKNLHLLLFLLPLTVFGQQSNAALLNLRGTVKSTQTFMYWRTNDTQPKEVKTQRFNRDGYLLSDESYFDDSTRYYIQKWSLDSNNHIISSTSESHNQKQTPSVGTYYYEENNLIKSVTQYDDGIEVFEYSYDAANREIASKQFWNGTLEYSNETIISENGSPDTLRQYWSNRGEKITIFLTPAQSDTCITLVCKDGLCEKNTVCRDSLGNDIETKKEMKNGSIDISRFEYSYDDYGNWIKKSQIKGDSILFSWRRTVEYYKE